MFQDLNAHQIPDLFKFSHPLITNIQILIFTDQSKTIRLLLVLVAVNQLVFFTLIFLFIDDQFYSGTTFPFD